MRWCIDGHKVNFARGKIPSGGKRSRKCIYRVPGQETAIHHAKFSWPPVNDVSAVTKARRDNPLKFTEVAQTRQQISAVSRPKFTILWGHVEDILLLNKLFFPIVDIRALVSKI